MTGLEALCCWHLVLTYYQGGAVAIPRTYSTKAECEYVGKTQWTVSSPVYRKYACIFNPQNQMGFNALRDLTEKDKSQ